MVVRAVVWAGRAAAVLVVLTAIVLAVAPAATHAAEPAGGPVISVTPNDVATNEWVGVQGQGFAGSSLAIVETCSTASRSVAPDQEPQLNCEAGTSVNAPVRQDGTVATQLHVVPPIGGCPCYVRVANTTEPQVGSASITVDDVPGAVPVASVEESVEVGGVSQVRVLNPVMRGSDSFATWFGLSPSRVFAFTLENSGTTTIIDPPTTVAVGRSANPDAIVTVPAVGDLKPGEKRRVEVPVSLGALAVGSYAAVGRVTVGGEITTFAGSTTSYPWGLIIVPLLIVFEVVLIRGRNRLRRAVHPPTAEVLAPTGPADGEWWPADVDSLVDAAIAGAFANGSAGMPSPIDVRPIVAAAVTGAALSGPAPDVAPAGDLVAAMSSNGGGQWPIGASSGEAKQPVSTARRTQE